jgi:putative colanic acid biosynthesis UDP-glucose lipid carrier transferase
MAASETLSRTDAATAYDAGQLLPLEEASVVRHIRAGQHISINADASNQADLLTESAAFPQLVSLSDAQAFCKRALDIVAGASALVLLAPLLLIVAVVICIDSKGSPLYRQARTGLHGKIFRVYKFRTMHNNSDAEFKQAEKNDPRITRIGGLLRRTSIDELPQLLNVITGSMSLVGPRPHPVKLDQQFKQLIPLFDSRYLVKPGITGLAQIKGFRGETKDATAMANRIRFDRTYIANWSLTLDLKLLFVTAFKGWVHKNAY